MHNSVASSGLVNLKIMKIRYKAGRLLKKLGYEIKPEWKTHAGTIHPLHLAGAVLKARNGGSIGNILQIGVYDGIQNDPLFGSLINAAAAITLVEPQPSAAAALRNRFEGDSRIRIIEAAVTDRPGEVMLYSENESSPSASIIPTHHRRFGQKNHSKTILVRGITPEALIAETGGKTPDLLQIDTEGMDWIIVKFLLAAGCQPAVINFENLHLGRAARLESRTELTKYGYRYLEYGWDTCAVSKTLGI